jgi:hypothetical protein
MKASIRSYSAVITSLCLVPWSAQSESHCRQDLGVDEFDASLKANLPLLVACKKLRHTIQSNTLILSSPVGRSTHSSQAL